MWISGDRVYTLLWVKCSSKLFMSTGVSVTGEFFSTSMTTAAQSRSTSETVKLAGCCQGQHFSEAFPSASFSFCLQLSQPAPGSSGRSCDPYSCLFGSLKLGTEVKYRKSRKGCIINEGRMTLPHVVRASLDTVLHMMWVSVGEMHLLAVFVAWALLVACSTIRKQHQILWALSTLRCSEMVSDWVVIVLEITSSSTRLLRYLVAEDKINMVQMQKLHTLQ